MRSPLQRTERVFLAVLVTVAVTGLALAVFLWAGWL